MGKYLLYNALMRKACEIERVSSSLNLNIIVKRNLINNKIVFEYIRVVCIFIICIEIELIEMIELILYRLTMMLRV